MKTWWREKKITKVVAGTLALLGASFSCRAEAPLPPVEAALAPAAAGARFAPVEYKAQLLPDTPLPPRSTGTHVTAVLRRASGAIVVAVWGDPVLWERKGNDYRAATELPPLPDVAAEVVALQEVKGKGIIVDTRRAGEFAVERGAWKSLPRANKPLDANAQALAAYRGSLYVATLNDGLVIRDAKGVWRHASPPVISTNAPRQFAIWRDNLYVRHGSGVVDVFDGRAWTRDVFTKILPRRQVSALTVCGDTLLLAQWGGWSETTDGITFAHHFPEELNRLPITALLRQGEALYVGTQGRGLAEFDTGTNTLRCWHDERAGLGDDWITTLAATPTGGVVAGTFVAGAFTRAKDSTWRVLPATGNDCVTASAATRDAVFVALRRGGAAKQLGSDGTAILAAYPEAQTLLVDEANRLLWIGTRTAIYTAPLP